jgi:hypothetical protein
MVKLAGISSTRDYVDRLHGARGTGWIKQNPLKLEESAIRTTTGNGVGRRRSRCRRVIYEHERAGHGIVALTIGLLDRVAAAGGAVRLVRYCTKRMAIAVTNVRAAKAKMGR